MKSCLAIPENRQTNVAAVETEEDNYSFSDLIADGSVLAFLRTNRILNITFLKPLVLLKISKKIQLMIGELDTKKAPMCTW